MEHKNLKLDFVEVVFISLTTITVILWIGILVYALF